eukprot:m.35757 g.35757  ORF g.35757 m.35757 type:complete len:467 (+) comp5323_c0_seq1:2546-3946(+)
MCRKRAATSVAAWLPARCISRAPPPPPLLSGPATVAVAAASTSSVVTAAVTTVSPVVSVSPTTSSLSAFTTSGTPSSLVPSSSPPPHQSLALFGDTAQSLAAHLVTLGHLKIETDGRAVMLGASKELARNMSMSRSIRVVSNRTVRVLRESDKKELDEFPFDKAFFHVYPGAILLNQGTEYLVTTLDVTELVAHAMPVKVNYYTKVRDHSDVQVFNCVKELLPTNGGCALRLGQCTVHQQWYGFRKHSKRTREILSMHTMVLPSSKYTTRALWVTIPETGLVAIRRAGLDLQHAIHGAQHLLVDAVVAFHRHHVGDVDTEHAYPFQTRARPNHLVIHDTAPGGTGVVQGAFDRGGWELVTKALSLVTSCDCPEGCPKCVHSARCSEYNEALCKRGAVLLLKAIQEKIDGCCNDDDDDVHIVESDGMGRWEEDQPEEPGGYVPDEWARRVAEAQRRQDRRSGTRSSA